MWIRTREHDRNTAAVNTDTVGRICISSVQYNDDCRCYSVFFETNSKASVHIAYATREHAEKAYAEIMDAISRGESCIYSPGDGYLAWRYLC